MGPPTTDRRSTAVVLTLLVAIVLALGGVTSPTAGAGGVEVAAPPVTDNDFIPDERNLSDCIGALERPGCGSESRGGWRQNLVFVVMGLGLVVVFWRVAVTVRRGRETLESR